MANRSNNPRRVAADDRGCGFDVSIGNRSGIMSKFESNSEDEITCPYCDTRLTDDSWERADDGEDECRECGKKFYWCRDITVSYSATPDCVLNGEPHRFISLPRHPNVEFCEVCDKCQSVTK